MTSHLLYNEPNHPWVGKLLFDYSEPMGREFKGVIQEVSDNHSGSMVYVHCVHSNGDHDYCFVPREARSETGLLVSVV